MAEGRKRLAMTGMFNPASSQADAISQLFIAVLGVCAVVFLVVVSIITYAIVRFVRERARGEHQPDAVEHEIRWLEATWTAIPLAIVTGIFVLSVRAADEADPSYAAKPDVIVRGHQWWWEIEYPEIGVRTANELHIPVGTKVHLQLESADVVHDFWVPALSRKMDMIPGQENHLVFQVDRSGRYEGACAEFCGSQHAWMRLVVFVQPLAEYEAWLAAQAVPAPPPQDSSAQAGLAVYRRETCDRCHTLRGARTTAPPSEIGPDLTHVASRHLLGSGVLPNDEFNLLLWLKDPQAIKEGCHMPNFQLSDQDASDLAAYLGGLQ